MANPHTNPDPPVSLSAADLRRRLMASTPPPMGGGLSPAEASAAGVPAVPDALARLRLPGTPPAPAAHSLLPPSAGSSAGEAKAAVPRRVIPTVPPAPGSGGKPFPPPRTPSEGGSGVRGYAHRAPMTEETAVAEAQRLKTENKELRKLLDEMKHLLQEASDTEQQYANREQDLNAALAEQQRHVQELSAQLQGIEEQIASGALSPQQPQVVPKTRTELEDWADELERDTGKVHQERKTLEAERQQLREDEESLEKQMRQMEVSMARERAMMARQETELKRLSAEIQHDLEIMQRGDANLRDQMQKFQRRAQDVLQGNPGGPPRR